MINTLIRKFCAQGTGRAALAFPALLTLLLSPLGCQKAGDGLGLDAVGNRLELCDINPEDPACKPVDPCLANPSLPQCLDTCQTNPPAPGCSVDVCALNPSDPNCPQPKVKFDQVLPILVNPASNCIQCHLAGGQGATTGKLLLSEDSAYANLVNSPVAVASYAQRGWLLVRPGSPDSSWFYLKISMASPRLPEGTGIGARMPMGYAPLDTGSINLIKRWILDGALK